MTVRWTAEGQAMAVHAMRQGRDMLVGWGRFGLSPPVVAAHREGACDRPPVERDRACACAERARTVREPTRQPEIGAAGPGALRGAAGAPGLAVLGEPAAYASSSGLIPTSYHLAQRRIARTRL